MKAKAQKPDWKFAPSEAMYLAQDADGTWVFYTCKPYIEARYNRWNYRSGEHFDQNKCAKNPDWKNTLESRPIHPD